MKRLGASKQLQATVRVDAWWPHPLLMWFSNNQPPLHGFPHHSILHPWPTTLAPSIVKPWLATARQNQQWQIWLVHRRGVSLNQPFHVFASSCINALGGLFSVGSVKLTTLEAPPPSLLFGWRPLQEGAKCFAAAFAWFSLACTGQSIKRSACDGRWIDDPRGLPGVACQVAKTEDGQRKSWR